MRILLSTPHPLWPDSSGAARRTLAISTALAGQGHAVGLLSPDRRVPDAASRAGFRHLPYRGLGTVGHFINPFFSAALAAALARGQDLLLAAYPYQAGALTRLSARFRVPLIYDAHNCEADRAQQLRGAMARLLVSRREAQLVSDARLVLCVSAADQELFRRRYGLLPALLPNGVDTGCFRPGQPDPALVTQLGMQSSRIALFFGSFDYAPNRRALQRLLELDWPLRQSGLPDTRLLVVGRGSDLHTPRRPGVLAVGEVEDISRYIQLANIVLAPLEEGGGTRLKIIEALACAQLVLSTRFGAMGLEHAGIEGLHCCDWPQFGATLHRLLAGAPQPGANTGGLRWAQTMDWNRLIAGIDWRQIASLH